MPDDLDGTIVAGIESLRQRVQQAILFRIRTWFLNLNRGVDYSLIQGHQTTASIAASTITAAIREEGGAEITAISNIEFSLDHDTRVYRYSCECATIYGVMAMDTLVV